MKNIYAILCLAFGLGTALSSQAQCDAGEVEVEIIIHTDAYGYEVYWELVPGGNDCGVDAIETGGNDVVGCDGGGDQQQNTYPGFTNLGYDDYQDITVGPWCIVEGTELDIHHLDDWADGGTTFEIIINGYPIELLTGQGMNDVLSFIASEPPAHDLAISGTNIDPYMSTGMIDITATVRNGGSETITDFDLNYSVDGGATVTSSISGASLGFGESDVFTHDIAWNADSNGDFSIEVWTSNPNGNEDANTEDDSMTIDFEVGPGIPNIIDDYLNIPLHITIIADASNQVNKPTDLDFHPTLHRKELWVINKDTESSGGSTVTILNAGEPDQEEIWKRDGNAWHFMSLPTGLAFSPNGNFASSPGVLDANHTSAPNEFTGPALWSSDLSIYAEESGGNGSHLDMLHESPRCQGIASETGNVFWVFDGFNSDVVRYNFVDDHGPGNSYHDDGRVLRYSDDEVARDPSNTIVSHLELDEDKQWLYVVDHGNDRVIRIDITTGTEGGAPTYGPHENIAEYGTITGYTQETVVSTGLTKPAGIDVIDDRMIVSEHESGEIVIYDISSIPAVELGRLETGMSSLQGINIGPDGKIWGVDFDSEVVFRIDESGLSADNPNGRKEPRLFPNPTANIFYIDNVDEAADFRLFDLSGKLVAKQKGQGQRISFDMSSFPAGVYTLQILGDEFGFTKKMVKL